MASLSTNVRHKSSGKAVENIFSVTKEVLPVLITAVYKSTFFKLYENFVPLLSKALCAAEIAGATTDAENFLNAILRLK